MLLVTIYNELTPKNGTGTIIIPVLVISGIVHTDKFQLVQDLNPGFRLLVFVHPPLVFNDHDLLQPCDLKMRTKNVAFLFAF